MILQFGNPMSYYIFMTELIDLVRSPNKNRWFNDFHDVVLQATLKHSVASRMLYPNAAIY